MQRNQDPPTPDPSMGAKADRRFLQRAAMDILYRTLNPREVAAYLDADAVDVVARLYATREAMDVWLEEELLYFLLLDNFRPRSEAIEDLPRRLQNGQVTVPHAVAELMLSTGFSLRNPGNDTFVTVVLEQGLGIEVQSRKGAAQLEAGKQIYDGQRKRFLGEQGASQADIIKIVIAQRDFTHHMLDRHHQRIMGRELANDDPAVDRLHGAPEEFFDVLGAWILSEEYRDNLQIKRHKSDHQFVRGLYMDLLGRLPAADELRNMRNAMLSMADPTPLRVVMAKVILDSGQARLPALAEGAESEFVATCFRNYLCREPGAAESAAFVQALRQEGASETQVVRALLGSPEYQFY